MKSEYQKMIAGEPYRPFDPELRALAQTARQKQASFNEEVDPIKVWKSSKAGLVQLVKISMSILVW